MMTTQKQCRLLVDAGNTLIKWSWLPGGEGAAAQIQLLGDCDNRLSAVDLAQALRRMAHTHGVDLSSVEAVYGACVAGDITRQNILAALQPLLQAQAAVQWVSSPLHAAALRNDYATPHTLGADRYLACLGLAGQLTRNHTVPPRAAVLATFGTATTVDAIRWDAAEQRYAYQGGIIIAGLAMALRSLHQHTALLPDLSARVLDAPPIDFGLNSNVHNAILDPIPNTTDAALWQGACWAQVGAVQGVIQRFQTLPTPHTPSTGMPFDVPTDMPTDVPVVYAAGGAAPALWPTLIQAFAQAQTINHPVLRGLAGLA